MYIDWLSCVVSFSQYGFEVLSILFIPCFDYANGFLWFYWWCYSRFHHSRWITLCMAFPYPAADSLDPMDYFLSFDVSLIIPKTIWKMIYADFYPITAYIRGFYPYNRVHRDVCIIQILLEFSLTWIRLIRLLAFRMPWYRSDSTLHYPFWSYIRNPLVHWKQRRENWE